VATALKMPRKNLKPNCYIIAGPNGAGKTTFATEFLPLYANCSNFINADLIARAYSPFDPDAGMLRAGRAVLERIANSATARADFAFETTLAGRSYVPVVRRLRSVGFAVHMFYLWIPAPELALLRIRDRVANGGHNVPEAAVRRRFRRTLSNLFALYRPLLDTLHFFDNSSDIPRLVFKDEAGDTSVLDVTLFEELQRKASQ
jgi:predicted ABC-type ATPase